MRMSYEQVVDDLKVDSETGEIIAHEQTTEIRSIINKKVSNEPDYIKIYKYVNTLFAYKGIKQSLTPFIIEISYHMTYANEGQIVNLNRVTKKIIADNLGVTIKRVDQVISELKKYDILRKIQNGVYSVNPYIVSRGGWGDVKKLQAHFDFATGQMAIEADVSDKITGYEIKKIITNSQTPFIHQIAASDNEEEKSSDLKTYVPDSKNVFNRFPQNKYDFAELEKQLLDN